MKEFKVREITNQVTKDEFGPKNIYEVFNSKTGEVKGWVVIDNTARSPKGIGKGGTAMYLSLDLAITMRKARTMTWKQVFCVPIGGKTPYEPWGGAKGGIVHDSNAPDAEEIAFKMIQTYFIEIVRQGFKRQLTLDEILNAYFYALARVKRKNIEMTQVEEAVREAGMKK